MLKKLRKLLVGKIVKETNTGNPSLKDYKGLCVDVVAAPPNQSKHFDVVFKSGLRCGFTPDTLTEVSAEGKIDPYIMGRRKFEVIS